MKNKQASFKNTILTTAISLVIAVVVCYYLGYTPFGDNTILTGDLNGIYVNFYSSFSDSILNGDGITYSFSKHLGGSTIVTFAYYVSGLFNLLYLFSNPLNYPEVATLIFILKTVSATFSMTFFLQKKNENSNFSIIIPSIAYGFCSYMLVYFQNTMWMDVLIYLPIICYGIDKIIKKNSPFVYIFTLSISLLSNFYIGYMVCFFSVIYFLYSLFLENCLLKENKFLFKKELSNYNIKTLLTFAFGSLISGGIAAILLVPTYFDLLNTKGFGEFIITGEKSFNIFEFFHRLLPFSFNWTDVIEGLPNVYVGCGVIVLAILYIFLTSISLKEKIADIVVTLLIFLTMYSYDLFIITHAFSQPVWFLYRNSFIFSFWLAFLAAKSLQNLKLPSKKHFILPTFAIICFLSLCYLIRYHWFTSLHFIIGTLIILALLMLFYINIFTKNDKIKKMSLIIACIICIGEITANSIFILSSFEPYSNSGYKYFVNAGEETLNLIENTALEDNIDSNHYRIEKPFFRSFNDSFLLGYKGMSHFSSTKNSTNSSWSADLLYYSDNTYGTGSTAFADSINSVKYLFARETGSVLTPDLSPTQSSDTVPSHFEKSISSDNISIYENPYSLPMVFVSNGNINSLNTQYTDVLKNADSIDFQNEIFNSLYNTNENLFIKEDVKLFLDDVQLTNSTLSFADTENKKITLETTSSTDGFAYAIFNNSNVTLLSSDNFDSNIIHLGEFKSGDIINVPIKILNGNLTLSDISIVVLDEALLSSFHNDILNSTNKYIKNLTIDNSSVNFDVSLDSTKAIVFSVIYDENLKIYANGEEITITPVFNDSLIAIELNEGEYEIELIYHAKGKYLGIIISIVSIIILILYYYFKKKKYF